MLHDYHVTSHDIHVIILRNFLGFFFEDPGLISSTMKQLLEKLRARVSRTRENPRNPQIFFTSKYSAIIWYLLKVSL